MQDPSEYNTPSQNLQNILSSLAKATTHPTFGLSMLTAAISVCAQAGMTEEEITKAVKLSLEFYGIQREAAKRHASNLSEEYLGHNGRGANAQP